MQRFQVLVTIYSPASKHRSSRETVILRNYDGYATSLFTLKHEINHVLLPDTFKWRTDADNYAEDIIHANDTIKLRAKVVVTA